MELVRNIKQDWRALRDGKPGRRFVNFYEFRKRHRRGTFSPARIFTIFIGLLLILGGLAIGWLPGPGGFIAIIGLALLAQEFRPIAALLDRIEPRLRAIWRWLRRRWRKWRLG